MGLKYVSFIHSQNAWTPEYEQSINNLLQSNDFFCHTVRTISNKNKIRHIKLNINLNVVAVDWLIGEPNSIIALLFHCLLLPSGH